MYMFVQSEVPQSRERCGRGWVRAGLLIAAGAFLCASMSACDGKDNASKMHAHSTPIMQEVTAAEGAVVASSPQYEVLSPQSPIYYEFAGRIDLNENFPQYVAGNVRFYWVDPRLRLTEIQPILDDIADLYHQSMAEIGIEGHPDGIAMIIDEGLFGGAAAVTEAAYTRHDEDTICGERPYVVFNIEYFFDPDAVTKLLTFARHEFLHAASMQMTLDWTFIPYEEAFAVAFSLSEDYLATWDMEKFVRDWLYVSGQGYFFQISSSRSYGPFAFPIFLSGYYDIPIGDLVGGVIDLRAKNLCNSEISESERGAMQRSTVEIETIMSPYTGGLEMEQLLALWISTLFEEFDSNTMNVGEVPYEFVQDAYWDKVSRYVWETTVIQDRVVIVDAHPENAGAQVVRVPVPLEDQWSFILSFENSEYAISAINAQGAPVLLEPRRHSFNELMVRDGALHMAIVYLSPEEHAGPVQIQFQ